MAPLSPPSTGLKSKIRKVFRTTSGPDRNFSLVSQLTSAALCASSPALPRASEVPPVVKSLLRPLSVPQLRFVCFYRAPRVSRTRNISFASDTFQGNAGVAAGSTRTIQGEARLEFYGKDRERGCETIAIEEEEQINRTEYFKQKNGEIVIFLSIVLVIGSISELFLRQRCSVLL